MNKAQLNLVFNYKRKGFAAYLPLGKYGLTIYGFRFSFREKYWAYYDYLDHAMNWDVQAEYDMELLNSSDRLYVPKFRKYENK